MYFLRLFLGQREAGSTGHVSFGFGCPSFTFFLFVRTVSDFFFFPFLFFFITPLEAIISPYLGKWWDPRQHIKKLKIKKEI